MLICVTRDSVLGLLEKKYPGAGICIAEEACYIFKWNGSSLNYIWSEDIKTVEDFDDLHDQFYNDSDKVTLITHPIMKRLYRFLCED